MLVQILSLFLISEDLWAQKRIQKRFFPSFSSSFFAGGGVKTMRGLPTYFRYAIVQDPSVLSLLWEKRSFYSYIVGVSVRPFLIFTSGKDKNKSKNKDPNN